jgi:protein tyrosine phosphatase (PTP) superfamily phosphohydrolase (DUF442 family)
MSSRTRGALIAALLVLISVVPFVYYRYVYVHGKRLRVVEDGKLYRSGQMTIDGFADAVKRYGIRTIVNAQDEYPDPEIAAGYFDPGTIKESELCRQLGVRYVYIVPDLIPRRLVPEQHPQAIDHWRELCDDPANYPILLHCRAGLHRTGVLTAVWRMEYDGWSPLDAIREMKAHGFGDYACTSANDYIRQYVVTYQPRPRSAD